MDLSKKKLSELREIAKSFGIENFSKLKKDELIELIKNNPENIKSAENVQNKKNSELGGEPKNEPKSEQKEQENRTKNELTVSGSDNLVGGILEVLPDNGFGFLRGENYLSTPKDVYVSPTQIRRFNLKTGDKVTGIARPPKDEEKFPALIFVQHVNDDTPDKAIRRKPFEYLTPIFPTERIRLESGKRTIQ